MQEVSTTLTSRLDAQRCLLEFRDVVEKIPKHRVKEWGDPTLAANERVEHGAPDDALGATLVRRAVPVHHAECFVWDRGDHTDVLVKVTHHLWHGMNKPVILGSTGGERDATRILEAIAAALT